MKLTPIDIKKQEFKRTLRGYDHGEVDAFLETMANQWELLLNEKSGLEERVRSLEMEIQKFKQVESMLHQTLAQAQQSSTSTVENARKEAENIKNEAQLEATRMVDNANSKVETINQTIQRLLLQRHEIISKLKILLTSQMELLDSLHKESDNEINHTMKDNTPKPITTSETAENGFKQNSETGQPGETENGQNEVKEADPDQFFEPIDLNPEKKEDSSNDGQNKSPGFASDQNSLSSQTTRITVPLEEPRKKGTSNRDLNIDDILDSLE